MASFGKRGVVKPGSSGARTRAGNGSHVDSEHISLAVAAVQSGKLPIWTKTGPYPLVLGSLFFAAAFWFFIVPFVGDVVRDQRLAGSWQPSYDMRAQDGKCTRYQLIATHCTARIKSVADPKRAPAEVGYLMGFTSGAGEYLVPVRSRIDPSVVTIAYFAETQLWNRTITLLVFSGVLILFILIAVHRLLTGRYEGGAEYIKFMAALEMLSARSEPEVRVN